MPPFLTAQDVLEVWELGQKRAPVDRALLLLTASSPDDSWEDLAALPIGQRDARLLTLREQLFGSGFVCQTACPQCGSHIELSFTVEDVRAERDAAPQEEFSLSTHGHEVKFRLPTSGDVLAIAGGAEDSDRALLDQCVLEAHQNGEQRTAAELPTEVVGEIGKRMSEADPQAETRASVTCSSCGHRWESILDISQFLWAEIESWALRTLREIHQLASAYGWTESEILRLSPWRRQFYLQCVR